MTNKHTPGPWTFDNENDGCRPILSEAHGEIVVTVGLINDDEDLANALLVAAAPDMAAALRAFLFQVMQGKVLERDAVVTQAREALFKAGVLAWPEDT